jgi:hypothetical protein
MLAFGVHNHNLKSFRSRLGLTGGWPGVNKNRRRAGVPSYLIRPKSNKTSQIHGQPKK